MILSNIDIIYDVLILIPYVGALLYAIYALFKLAPGRKRIFMAMIIICSIIYSVQTLTSAITGSTSSVRLWDIYNICQSLVNLVAVQLITRMSGTNMKDNHDFINKIPLI